MIVTCMDSFSFLKSFITSFADFESKLPVGSSASSIEGSLITALAIATL